MGKMTTRSILLISVVVFGASVVALPARAITAGDVLDWMSSEERAGYLAGTVEMAAFLSGLAGNKKRADCIMAWYFDRKDGPRQITEWLGEYKERQALPVIHLVITEACGE